MTALPTGDKENGARWRKMAPLQIYRRLALLMTYAIALALIFRHTGMGAYEGVITFAGVFCAWAAGVLSNL